MNHSALSPAPPSWLRFVLFLAGMGVCAVSQWYIFHRTEWYWSSWGLVLGAIVAAWAAGRPVPMRAPETAPLADTAVSRSAARWGAALTSVGLMLALYGSWQLSVAWEIKFEIGFVLVVVGSLVFSYGISRLDRPFRKAAEPLPWLRWEIIAFVAILLLGLFLRFYRYDTFPPPDGICAIEEPQSGMGAVAIRNGLRPWEFLLDRWIPVPFMALLGDTLTAIRLPFTIVSWLTIIPLYLLLRELVSRPAALSATLLFSFCRWHLIYARHAHAIFGPTLPLILLALFLAVRVYRRGGLAAYPWIGLICAYTLYTYAGYRATPAFIGLFFAISVAQHIWERRRAVIPSARAALVRSLRVQFAGFALAGIGFLLLATPLYYRLTVSPTYFVEALDRATNNPNYYSDDTSRMLQQRVERLRDTAMMFNHHGDGSGVFNVPGKPQLDPVSGTLLVLGLAYCIVWAGVRMQGFFAFYFVVLLAFGTIFVHNFDIRRLQGIIPLIFILAAFFLDGALQVTRRRLGRIAWAPLALVAALFGGVAFADNYQVYFREMMSSMTVRTAFHTNYTIAIRYVHDMPQGSYVRLISDMGNFFDPSDYAWWRGDRIPGDTSHDLYSLLNGQQGPWVGRELHVLVRLPMYEGDEIAALLERRFPTANCGVYQHPDGPRFATFVTCKLGPEAHSDGATYRGGVRARYYRGGSEVPLVERYEPAISYGLVPDACRFWTSRSHLPCNAVWEGTWTLAAPGEYQLMANVRSGTVRLFVDGRPIDTALDDPHSPERGVVATLSLTAGAHHVRVESDWDAVDTVGTRLRTRRGGESRWQLVEFTDLAAVEEPWVELDPSDGSDSSDASDASDASESSDPSEDSDA